MTQSKAIADRLRDVMLSGTWIANVNIKMLIETLDLRTATQRIHGLNSIAMLVFHLNYYLEGILKVFDGGPLDIRDKYSFDCPPISTDEAWHILRDTFINNAERFCTHVANMSDQDLAAPFVDEKYGDYTRNIEGVIEHSYYHLGQMVIIDKMIKSQES